MAVPAPSPSQTGARFSSPEHPASWALGLLSFSLQIPVSMCSKDCRPGQKKKPVGIHPCCFECLDCLPGTFLNRTAGRTCRHVPLPHLAPPHPGLSEPFILAGGCWSLLQGPCLISVYLPRSWCREKSSMHTVREGGRRNSPQPGKAVTDPHSTYM